MPTTLIPPGEINPGPIERFIPSDGYRNLPQAWYPEAERHGERFAAGWYTDHRNPTVEELVYRLRDQYAGERDSHARIAQIVGFQSWRDSYNCVRNIGRRRNGERGRDTDGNLRWRAWNRRRTFTADTAPTRDGSRTDQSLATGRFGIEIEFNSGARTHGAAVRSEAERLMADQSISVRSENYNHTVQTWWKMTTDATVTGGECVSPIMDGTTASLDEVRDTLRAIKQAGGVTGRNCGMHVHHDATMFDTPEARERLVRTLQAVEQALAGYVLQERLTGNISCSSALMRSDGWNNEWDSVAADARNITPGASPRGSQDYGSVTRYRFFNICGPLHKYGSVEFRGLGGTLHAGKVRVWVRMGQAIMEAARQGHTFAENLTSEGLVDELRALDLIGRRTGERFLSECERRRNG